MMLPSKELLSVVFNRKVCWLMLLDEDTDTHNTLKVHFQFNDIYYGGVSGIEDEQINIYELAHKCKEWAISQGYQFRVYYQCDGSEEWYIGKCGFEWDAFKGDSVFEACQWILDNKDKR